MTNLKYCHCQTYRLFLQDRPDLIQSELAGLAFDSLQQVFRKSDVEIMFASPAIEFAKNTTVWLVVDPAAGGPQSDYALVTICRSKGCVVVSAPHKSRQHVAFVGLAHEVVRELAFVDTEAQHDVLAHV